MATQLDSGAPASARPTGTVTFLFSDIEGSTVRWERDREAMAAALARHDALMRAAMEARGAYIFKTMGDAFCRARIPDAGGLETQGCSLTDSISLASVSTKNKKPLPQQNSAAYRNTMMRSVFDLSAGDVLNSRSMLVEKAVSDGDAKIV